MRLFIIWLAGNNFAQAVAPMATIFVLPKSEQRSIASTQGIG
jgi:hypothetical protein